MVEWREEQDNSCDGNIVTNKDIMFCMAMGVGVFGGVEPLDLPSFNVTTRDGKMFSEEKSSVNEVVFREECEKYGVLDYKLLRACILYDSPESVWNKDDLWLATLSSVGFYVEMNAWARNRVLDFDESDIVFSSKVKLKMGGCKTFRVCDINMSWLEVLDSRQAYSDCSEALAELFKYMERFKDLPVCMRLVTTEHVKHAYLMKRWYLDAQ